MTYLSTNDMSGDTWTGLAATTVALGCCCCCCDAQDDEEDEAVEDVGLMPFALLFVSSMMRIESYDGGATGHVQ